MSQRLCKSTIPSAIKDWQILPGNVRDRFTRNSFKYKLREHVRGRKNHLITTKIKLNRKAEIIFNKSRCDLILNDHLFSHNFSRVTDPSCLCGSRRQTLKHVFFDCPLTTVPRTKLLDDLGGLPAFFNEFNVLRRSEDRLKALLWGLENVNRINNSKAIECTSLFLCEICEIFNIS